MKTNMLVATLFFATCLEQALNYQFDDEYKSKPIIEPLNGGNTLILEPGNAPYEQQPQPATDPLDELSFLDAEAGAVEDWLRAEAWLKLEAQAKRLKANGIKPLMPSEWVNILDQTMKQATNDQEPFEDK